AAAALADQTEGLAAPDREGHVADREHLARLAAEPGALARVEGIAQALDLEQHARAVGARSGLIAVVAQQSAARRGDLADRRQALARRHAQTRHRVQARLEVESEE